MYKPDVQSRTVDMSEGLGYKYSKTDAIKRTFKLSSLISRERLEKLEQTKNQIVTTLAKTFEGTERLSIVNWVTCYEKDGSIFARLEALPGNYELVVGDDEYTYNIKWPPERFPDTHDDSK
jgi:tRNA A37 methylthiotransferase MiaB